MVYKVQELKGLAHLSTKGAYVQKPNPQIVGRDPRTVIGSQDAKSLYPTIMVLLNIGFDTLKGRFYDEVIVGKFLHMLENHLALLKTVTENKKEILQELNSKFAGVMRNKLFTYVNMDEVSVT